MDDEPLVAALISRVLTEAGFQVLARVGTGAAAMKAARELDPDVVTLDLRLPDMRGDEVLAALLASYPARRVIVVSAVTDIATRVRVLDGGAVDYMSKPFVNAELVARVRVRNQCRPRGPELSR